VDAEVRLELGSRTAKQKHRNFECFLVNKRVGYQTLKQKRLFLNAYCLSTLRLKHSISARAESESRLLGGAFRLLGIKLEKNVGLFKNFVRFFQVFIHSAFDV
jgi:hypothetical protein